MFDIKFGLSEDKPTATLELPAMTEPLKLSAGELGEVIQHLAWLRASMLPANAPVDPTPGTPVSSVPAVRWFVSEDEIPEQSRLHLLHPGFGWLWIPLHQEAFDAMSEKIRLFLQPKPRMQ